VNQILIVEDEADMAATYERLLHRAGHRVVTAGSRTDGMQLLTSVRPTLVISDLRLPDGDGLDVLRAACALDPPPPVIIITAFASRAVRVAALESGACAFLAKPFRVAEVLSLLENLMKYRRPEGPASKGVDRIGEGLEPPSEFLVQRN
jgi:two-component system, repressor protein LuxO